jgi:hypothetical protein
MRLTRLPLCQQIALSLVLTVVFQWGCGGSSLLKSFRIALASSSPLVNSLANAGVIPQTKATAIIADFNDGATCGLNLQEAFNAIPKDLPASEIRSRKFQSSQSALTCFRAIINRQNFAANQRIQTAANIAEGILASLVIFYSSDATATVPSRNAVIARDEKDLEQKLKVRIDALEAALQP